MATITIDGQFHLPCRGLSHLAQRILPLTIILLENIHHLFGFDKRLDITNKSRKSPSFVLTFPHLHVHKYSILHECQKNLTTTTVNF